MSYTNFIDTCRSEETKKTYDKCLNQFMKYVGITNHDFLLNINAEDSIKQYIISKRDYVSSASLHKMIASIYHFYDMNDVVLNKVKISKYKGEFRKVKKDRTYTHQEIAKLLSVADLRLKSCILLMASSGLRLGAIPDIKLKHLQDNTLIVYEGSSEEYNTFVTQETLNFIQEYINYRRRFGENVTSEAYLIRNNFDDFGDKKDVRPVSKHTIRNIIYNLLRKTGIDKNIMMTHGFRKFFTTQLVNSKVNPEIREMLLGHKIGLAGSYYKPTVDEMYCEYEKAINNLTINEENRLKEKVEKLEIENNKIDRMYNEIHSIKDMLGLS